MGRWALWFGFSALILTQPVERRGLKIAGCYFSHLVPWLHQFLFPLQEEWRWKSFPQQSLTQLNPPLCGVLWEESRVESWRGGCLWDNAFRKVFLSWRHLRMLPVLKCRPRSYMVVWGSRVTCSPCGSLRVDSILRSIQLKALWSNLIFGKVWKVWKARQSSNLGLSRRISSLAVDF